ncbi:hotdog family protein [Marinobacter sp. OP 3.4]|uniref:hotdog family protein n=1 Tax=Marinobacter sp. OP 3.4 TaxID=3076501 RepID=UPI002E232125
MSTAMDGTQPQWSVDELIRHRGDISLLDRIMGHGDTWLEARAVITRANLFLEQGEVPAWVGIEYMAQAVAAWAGTQALTEGRPVRVGFLLGSRRYETSVAGFVEGSTLRIRVDQEMKGDNGVGVFNCRISGREPRGQAFEASARLNVFQPEEFDDLLKVES